MARPRKWNSEAERLAAYRKSKEEAVVDPGLPAVQLDEAGPPESAVRVPIVTLERYVQDIVDAALRFSISIGEDDGPFEIAPKLFVTNRRRDRLERAKRYAEWRYAGFRSGEVASL